MINDKKSKLGKSSEYPHCSVRPCCPFRFNLNLTLTSPERGGEGFNWEVNRYLINLVNFGASYFALLCSTSDLWRMISFSLTYYYEVELEKEIWKNCLFIGIIIKLEGSLIFKTIQNWRIIYLQNFTKQTTDVQASHKTAMILSERGYAVKERGVIKVCMDN